MFVFFSLKSPDSGQHNLMDGITGLSKEVEDVTFFQRKLFASNHSRVNDDSNGDDDIDLYPSVNMNSRRPPTPALLRFVFILYCNDDLIGLSDALLLTVVVSSLTKRYLPH